MACWTGSHRRERSGTVQEVGHRAPSDRAGCPDAHVSRQWSAAWHDPRDHVRRRRQPRWPGQQRCAHPPLRITTALCPSRGYPSGLAARTAVPRFTGPSWPPRPPDDADHRALESREPWCRPARSSRGVPAASPAQALLGDRPLSVVSHRVLHVGSPAPGSRCAGTAERPLASGCGPAQRPGDGTPAGRRGGCDRGRAGGVAGDWPLRGVTLPSPRVRRSRRGRRVVGVVTPRRGGAGAGLRAAGRG
jgi:hypothetical protein